MGLERFSAAESEATNAYNQAVKRSQAGELDDPGFAKHLRDSVLPTWRQGREQLDAGKPLPDKQQRFLDQVQSYARLREQAWTLFAEAIEQSDEEKLARYRQLTTQADAAVKAIDMPK